MAVFVTSVIRQSPVSQFPRPVKLPPENDPPKFDHLPIWMKLRTYIHLWMEIVCFHFFLEIPPRKSPPHEYSLP